MNRKIIFMLMLTVATATTLRAQLFHPYWLTPIYPYGMVVNQDGSVVKGRLSGSGGSRGGFFVFFFKDSTKQKTSIYATHAAYAIFWKTPNHAIPDVSEGIQNVKPKDFKKYFGDDFLSYVRMGPLNSIYYFGELANTNYCDKIKIYFAPLSYSTTSFRTSSSIISSYSYRWWNHNQYPFFVEKNGVTMKVRNGNYQHRFIELFHDCPELMKIPKKERKFAHFEEHVRIYDKTCG